MPDESVSLAVRKVPSLAEAIRNNVERVIIGKRDIIDLLLVALLSDGHVLIEDVPGIGKTMMAKSLARSLGATFQRVQGTPDLLPTDITAHIPQFRERKNRMVNTQDQADEEPVDGELAAPKPGFGSRNSGACARDQCPRNIGKSSASSDGWSVC